VCGEGGDASVAGSAPAPLAFCAHRSACHAPRNTHPSNYKLTLRHGLDAVAAAILLRLLPLLLQSKPLRSRCCAAAPSISALATHWPRLPLTLGYGSCQAGSRQYVWPRVGWDGVLSLDAAVTSERSGEEEGLGCAGVLRFHQAKVNIYWYRARGEGRGVMMMMNSGCSFSAGSCPSFWSCPSDTHAFAAHNRIRTISFRITVSSAQPQTAPAQE